MRDPARIDDLIEKLWDAWRANPDLRLGQLLVNLIRPGEPCPAVFYFEDAELLKRLQDPAARAASGIKLPTDATHGP